MQPLVYWKGKREIDASLQFAGMAFAAYSGNDTSWRDFPREFFCTPKVVKDTTTPFTLKPIRRVDTPDHATWLKQIDDCISRIKKGEIDKLVCARRTTFTFDTSLDPFQLVNSLKSHAHNCTLFAFQPTPHSAFVGATPETLFRRSGEEIFTHALAGTRPRGASAQADLLFEKELLSSVKDLREFAFVKDHLHAALQKLTYTLNFQQAPKVQKNALLQHLACNFSGTLKPNVTNLDILRALHPTPAVCGTPTKKALELISSYEPFDRGLYAAPLGWTGFDSAEFVVGIRSALVQENQLHLFAGAGIVGSSEPEREWQELEQKIGTFTRLWQ